MNNKILIYLYDQVIDKNQLKHVIEPLGYVLYVVSKEELNQKLGYLINAEGFEKENGINQDDINFDVMIIPTMEESDLKTLSIALQEHKIYVARKAMVTKHNQSWSLLDLMKEVDEEHHYFVKRHELQNLIMACMKLPQDKVNSEFQKNIMDAYDIIQNQESLQIDFEQAINLLLPKYTSVLN